MWDLLQKLSDKSEEGFRLDRNSSQQLIKRPAIFGDNLSKRFPNVAIVRKKAIHRDPVVSDYFNRPDDGTASFSAGFEGGFVN